MWITFSNPRAIETPQGRLLDCTQIDRLICSPGRAGKQGSRCWVIPNTAWPKPAGLSARYERATPTRYSPMALDFRPEPSTTAVRKRIGPLWLRRLGITGFVFFLVKGLLWLIVPVLIYFFGTD